MREAHKKKSKFHVKMHCKMNWKGASLGVCSRGALFPQISFFAIPILITPVFVFVCLFVFFFITFDVSFWHPFLCSVLVPHFQPLWRPLIRSDFFTFLWRPLIRSDFFTFLWIFWRPFLISVCYHSFQFLL